MQVLLLEKLMKKIMLAVGIAGVVIIYAGFLYLLFNGYSTAVLPWYLLLCPWICIYFGLTTAQQMAVYHWFSRKFSR